MTDEIINGDAEILVRKPEPVAAIEVLSFAARHNLALNPEDIIPIFRYPELVFVYADIYKTQLTDFIDRLADHVFRNQSLRSDVCLSTGIEHLRAFQDRTFHDHAAPNSHRFAAIERLAMTIRPKRFSGEIDP